jgi:large subunit ribosomal protein L24
MKQRFSTKWNASIQPRKQRKYLANAPLHIKRKMLSANLSEEIRKKYGIRSIELRKNDEVKIMRGKFAKRQGKITAINKRKMKASVEGIQKTKKDGTKVNIWFHASKLQIIGLNTDDKKRLKNLSNKPGEIKENAHN